MSNIKEAIAAHLMAVQEEQDAIPIEDELVIGRVKVEVVGVVQPRDSFDTSLRSLVRSIMHSHSTELQ
jgi:hypothetical protein